MRLSRAVLVEDIIIDLPRAIDVGEVDQPVAPAAGIVDRKGTDERRAGPERLEHEPLGGAEPAMLAHRAVENVEPGWLDVEGPKLRGKLYGVRLLEEGQQCLDREGVENLDRGMRAHDVEQRRVLDTTVAALVKVEQDIAVAALFEKLLHPRIARLEGIGEIFDAQMQAADIFDDVGLQWCDMSPQCLDRVAAVVVEDKQTFDLDQAESLRGALRVNRLDRAFQLLDEDERRARGAALVATAAGKSVDT